MLLSIDSFNRLRRVMVSPDPNATETRKDMAAGAVQLKRFAAGAGVVSLASAYGLSSIPLVGNVCVIGGIAIAVISYDIFCIGDNIETMCKSGLKDRAFSVWSKAEFTNKVLANTLLTKPLLGNKIAKNMT